MPRKNFIKNWIIGFLEFFPILIVYGIAKILPIDWSACLFSKLASIIGPRLKVSKRGFDNLKNAFPEKKDKEINTLVKETWENLGRIAGEFPHVQKIANDPKRVEVVNLQYITEAKNSDKPCLMLAGHLGNWELPHYIVLREGLSIGLISRPPNNPWTKKFFDCIRYNPKVPIFYKSVEGSRKIIKFLAQGGTMGILFDQRLSDGAPLPFFNRPALTSIGPAKLAKRFNGKVIPVQVARLGKKSRFKVTFYPPLDMDKSPEEIMTIMNKHLESWIRETPSQWLWFHKRWKL
jgi:KDO2-lipid IV(A) lauroyltransferase